MKVEQMLFTIFIGVSFDSYAAIIPRGAELELDFFGVQKKLVKPGSGVNVHNSNIQPSCFDLKSAKLNRPIVDVEIKYQVINEGFMKKLDFQTRDPFYKSFIETHYDRNEPQRTSAVVRVNMRMFGEGVEEAELRGEIKNMIIDAAGLSPNQMLTAFVDRCGTHFVRSVVKDSNIFAIFSYNKLKDDSKNREFSRALEAYLTGSYSTTPHTEDLESTEQPPIVTNNVTEYVHRASKNRNLYVYTSASGLAAWDKEITLPLSFDQFRSNLVKLVGLMGTDVNPDTGRVTGVEIVNWLDTHYLWKLIPPGVQERIYASENLRIIQSLKAAIDKLSFVHTRAPRCLVRLNEYRTKDEIKSDVMPILAGPIHGYDPDKTLFTTTNGAFPIKLRLFRKILNPAALMMWKNTYIEQMNKATFCIENLENKGITNVLWDDLPSCFIAATEVSEFVPFSFFIKQYCMPTIKE